MRDANGGESVLKEIFLGFWGRIKVDFCLAVAGKKSLTAYLPKKPSPRRCSAYVLLLACWGRLSEFSVYFLFGDFFGRGGFYRSVFGAPS